MVLSGDGNGGFADPDRHPIGGVSSVVIVDLNDAGTSDLAATVGKTVVVTLNDGRGKSPRSFINVEALQYRLTVSIQRVNNRLSTEPIRSKS